MSTNSTATPVVALTADYQLIVDPGSDADRGLVSIVGVRVHFEGVLGRT